MAASRVYVSASFPRQAEARGIAGALREAGHEVPCGWLDQESNLYQEDEGELKELALREAAIRDLQDIVECNVLVMLSGDSLSGGGRHTEFGIALALGKRVILVGPRENVMHRHPEVEHATFETLLEVLG